MTDVAIHPVVRHDADACDGSGDAAPGLASWLGLAGAPTFALMAQWSAFFSSQPDMICTATQASAPMSAMTVMYLLMSGFHLSPWLKLISGPRKGARRHDRAPSGH